MQEPQSELRIGTISEEAASADSTQRTFATRALFRFVLVYFLLYCTFGGLGAVRTLSPWVAVHVFHLSGPATRFHPSSSGDTTLEYVSVFCYAVLAAIAALAWSAVDRSEGRAQSLYRWVRLLVRFFLAAFLLFYGLGKIFPMQFPSPDFVRLSETFGEASPMGLLWAFMGASTPYQMFSGLAEVIPGLLLLFRRTATLGALLAMAVMTNVVALNYCYDVPVKLFSSHLWLLAVFLLVPDVTPLWQFFVQGQNTGLKPMIIPRLEHPAVRITGLVAKGLLIVLLVLAMGLGYLRMRMVPGAMAQLEGVWQVDRAAGSSDNGAGWERVMIPAFGRIGVRTADGKLLRFTPDTSAKKKTIELKGWGNDHLAKFKYEMPRSDDLILDGSVDGEAANLHFRRVKPVPYLLETRGFHWISEDPYNI